MGILTRFKKQETKEEKEEKKDVVKAGIVASAFILSPVVTEKTAYLASRAQYVFLVDIAANKIQVRNAIRTMYGITPVSINMQNQDGKRVRSGRSRGIRKRWKKAIVTLPEGKSIEVYEGV